MKKPLFILWIAFQSIVCTFIYRLVNAPEDITMLLEPFLFVLTTFIVTQLLLIMSLVKLKDIT